MKGWEGVSIKQVVSEDSNYDYSRSGLTVLMIFIINYPTGRPYENDMCSKESYLRSRVEW